MNDQFRNDRVSGFKGVTIDTAANRRSVMSKGQHKQYEIEFGVVIPLRPPSRQKMKGIGGEGKVIGDASIPIPFNKLNIIIDVDFLIIDSDCPSLLSNRDMIINRLDISIKGSFLHMGPFKPLTFSN